MELLRVESTFPCKNYSFPRHEPATYFLDRKTLHIVACTTKCDPKPFQLMVEHAPRCLAMHLVETECQKARFQMPQESWKNYPFIVNLCSPQRDKPFSEIEQIIYRKALEYVHKCLRQNEFPSNENTIKWTMLSRDTNRFAIRETVQFMEEQGDQLHWRFYEHVSYQHIVINPHHEHYNADVDTAIRWFRFLLQQRNKNARKLAIHRLLELFTKGGNEQELTTIFDALEQPFRDYFSSPKIGRRTKARLVYNFMSYPLSNHTPQSLMRRMVPLMIQHISSRDMGRTDNRKHFATCCKELLGKNPAEKLVYGIDKRYVCP